MNPPTGSPRSARSPTVSETAQDAVGRLGPWFHNVTLPDGTQTCPAHPLGLGDFPRWKWDQIKDHLPGDLGGARALDIGCNAGFYALELARRGAHVVAIDHDERYLRQATWVVEQWRMHDRIDLRLLDVYDLDELDAAFDVVLFMGTFYHLRYPLLGLDTVARHCRDTMVFQTLSMPGDGVQDVPADFALNDRQRLIEPGFPTMAFIERRMAGDPTNWWLPNRACIEAMLRSAGFTVTARPGDETYLCRRV